MIKTETLPPHDSLNEQAALGCVLLDSSALDVLLSSVGNTDDFFYELRHRIILSAFRRILEAARPISALAVITELRAMGELEAVGGMAYISSLPEATPSAAHLPYCLDVLRKKFVARRMIAACTEAIGAAYKDDTDSAELLESFKDNIATAEGSIKGHDVKPIKDILGRCVDRYERMLAGEEAGLATGFFKIDAAGGLAQGELVLLCGTTGLGKSTLALNILHTNLKNGVPCALFSFEMSDEAWMDRLLSLDLSIDRSAFRSKDRFNNGVMQKLASAIPRLSKLPLWISDDTMATVDDMRRTIKKMVERSGIRMVVVDYAQIVSPPKSVESREQQVAYIGRTLRSIAQETKVVMIVLSQLNDDGKVRESRALLHEAHVCITLQQREERLWVALTKGRDMNFQDFPVDFHPLNCKITQAEQFDTNEYR